MLHLALLFQYGVLQTFVSSQVSVLGLPPAGECTNYCGNFTLTAEYKTHPAFSSSTTYKKEEASTMMFLSLHAINNMKELVPVGQMFCVIKFNWQITNTERFELNL